MAEKFQMQGWFKAANRLMSTLVRLGVTPNHTVLLTVPGRKSGTPRTTPVTVIAIDGQRYVNAPFGAVDWVRNVRAAQTVTISVGRRAEEVVFEELPASEAAPVLRQALAMAPKMVRQQFNGLTAQSPLADIEREAPNHPVFRIRPAAALAQAS